MAQNTSDLIQNLLKSGRVSADTREDLEGFKRELDAGELDDADRRYIEALAKRLLDGVEISEEEEEEGLYEEEDDGEWEALEERAENAEARVEELEAENEELLRRIDALEGELATYKDPGAAG